MQNIFRSEIQTTPFYSGKPNNPTRSLFQWVQDINSQDWFSEAINNNPQFESWRSD